MWQMKWKEKGQRSKKCQATRGEMSKKVSVCECARAAVFVCVRVCLSVERARYATDSS